MALSTLLLNPNSSVVGSEAVSPKLEKYKNTGMVDINFKVLPSNGMGGYGQYYSGSLYELRLTSRTEEGIERCAPGTAQELAQAYDSGVSKTPFCKGRFFEDNAISMKVLQRSAKPFSLDALGGPLTHRERKLLLDLFYSWDNPRPSTADLMRRQTLGLVLHVVSQYGKSGFDPLLSETDDYLVYPPYYYRVLLFGDKKPIHYDLPPQFAVCCGFWKQFCVHEFLTLALEYLLEAVLGIASEESNGIPVESICHALAGPDFRSTLKTAFGECGRPHNLLKRLNIEGVPSESHCLDTQKRLGIRSKESEWNLVELPTRTPEVGAALSVALLAVLYAKWRNSPNEYSQYIFTNAGHNLSAGTVLPQLDEWLNPGLTWPKAFRHLIEPLILEQHDRIMYEKGKLESCWLHRVEGRVLKDQDYIPVFRASRHWNCVKILNDLELLEIDASGAISITKEGRQVMSRVLNEHGPK